MTLEYYRNFVAVADSGSILAASGRLMIAQPALSNQIKAMEREYGVRLIHRGARGVTLTDAGKILYQKAKFILSLEESAKQEIQDSEAGITGTLSLALPPTNSEPFLQGLFAKYRRAYPHVRIVLHELTSDEIPRYVSGGITELGFIRAPIRGSDLFDFYRAPNERLGVFLPNGHPLAEKDALTPLDLREERLCIPRAWMGPIRDLCARYSFTPEFLTVATSRVVVLRMAKLEGSLALVPYSEEEGEVPGFVRRDFSPEPIFVSRAFIANKNVRLSVAANNFLRCQGFDITVEERRDFPCI